VVRQLLGPLLPVGADLTQAKMRAQHHGPLTVGHARLFA
jgi:hypothetical protein